MVPPMARGLFRKTDKTVDRIGYWYGFFRLLWDHRYEVGAAVAAGAALMGAYGYQAWHFVQTIAAEVGPLFYVFLAATALFALLGIAFATTLIARLVRGKSWLGFERDLKIAAGPTKADRLALAERANLVAKKVSSIYGQWEADHSIAWHEDSERMSEASKAGKNPFSIRSAADNVNRKYIEKYSEQCLAEVWSVIGLSRKFVAIDRSALWGISHGARSAHDLHAIVVLLGSIEASLRHDEQDLPFFEKN